MIDAPETIWASHCKGKTRTILQGHANEPIAGWTKYRRDDLPITDAQIMADERVKALVEALERIAHASDIYSVEANAEDQGADTLAYAHKSTCNLARAALAKLKEPKL